jgi:hypothetical protein
MKQLKEQDLWQQRPEKQVQKYKGTEEEGWQ